MRGQEGPVLAKYLGEALGDAVRAWYTANPRETFTPVSLTAWGRHYDNEADASKRFGRSPSPLARRRTHGCSQFRPWRQEGEG